LGSFRLLCWVARLGIASSNMVSNCATDALPVVAIVQVLTTHAAAARPSIVSMAETVLGPAYTGEPVGI
jgi:hypothetical protein